MSKQIKLIRVFVSSPEDVVEERESVKKVIEQINQSLFNKNIRLEYVGWDTHVVPGVGCDSQAVINEQINNDYDIFLGIMWQRIGSPTPREQSGTVEEFKQALKRNKDNPDNLQILFYFSEKPIPPSLVDSEQLNKLQDFKKELENEGVVYKPFQDISDFENLLRTHLLILLNKLGNTPIAETSATPELNQMVETPNSPNDSDGKLKVNDYGILEYIDIANKKLVNATEVQYKISDLMADFGDKTRRRTNQINSLKSQQNPNITRRLLDEIADDLDHFSDQMEIEVSKFSDNFNDSIEFYGLGLIESTSLGPQNHQNLKITEESLDKLRPSIREQKDAMISLRDSISSIPRFTSKLNKAKLRATEILGDFITTLDSNYDQVNSVLGLISDILSDYNK